MRQTYHVPAPLLLAVAEYLTQRPYREVATFLAEIGRMKDEQDRTTEDPEPEGKQP